jgi:hypothetical protein
MEQESKISVNSGVVDHGGSHSVSSVPRDFHYYFAISLGLSLSLIYVTLTVPLFSILLIDADDDANIAEQTMYFMEGFRTFGMNFIMFRDTYLSFQTLTQLLPFRVWALRVVMSWMIFDHEWDSVA